MTLDMLGDLEDGTEVAHWPGQETNDQPFPWDHQFCPEESDFYTTL